MLSDVRDCDTNNGGCDHICIDFLGGGTTARAGVGSEQMEIDAQVYWKSEEVYCTTPSMPNDVALKVTESLYILL